MERGVLRLLLLLIAAGVSWSGVSLVADEGPLVGARLIAREGRPAALVADDAAIDGAYRAFSQAAGWTDVVETELGLALELDRRGFPRAFVASPVREERIASSARRLAHASPVAAEAWCMLALAEAKAQGRSSDAVNAHLRACYRFGPREIVLYEARLDLAYALWDELPKDVRRLAMTDAAAALRDRHFNAWAIERLSYGAAIIAPARAAIFLPLIQQYGSEAELRFQRSLVSHRRRYSDRAGEFSRR